MTTPATKKKLAKKRVLRSPANKTFAIKSGPALKMWRQGRGITRPLFAQIADCSERTLATFRAGCDMALHCNGNLAEMTAVAGETPAYTSTGWISVTPGDHYECFVFQNSGGSLSLRMTSGGNYGRCFFEAEFLP